MLKKMWLKTKRVILGTTVVTLVAWSIVGGLVWSPHVDGTMTTAYASDCNGPYPPPDLDCPPTPTPTPTTNPGGGG